MSPTKIKTAAAFLFFLCHFSGFAQNILTGTVKDSLQIPLPYANVIAEPQDSLYKIKFAITDEQGYYKLELEETSYLITASSMGYEPFTFKSGLNPATVKDIILQPRIEGLEAVVIELPVIVKEDTITYNVEKLLTGEERKLKDVLGKLPGVEVGRDGSIWVKGKEITTLLVENKKFFGGGTKLAIENIPADAVDQVVVLENYNEVAFLKGLYDSEETAMNIKLKEEKKNFVFGDIQAGKGNEDFYKAKANLFYYSPKTNINAIGNSNNTGEQVFTYQQYIDFEGGINQIFRKGSTSFSLPTTGFLQFMEREDVLTSDRNFGALNFTQEVNNQLNIAAYGILSQTRENTLMQAINQYNTFVETSEVSSQIDNLFAIGNLRAVYLPNLKDQWYFTTQFKSTNNQYDHSIIARVDTTGNEIFTNHDLEEKTFNQAVEWHRKSSRAHTFSMTANYNFSEQHPLSVWETSNQILQGYIPLMEASVYRLRQLKQIRNNHLDAIFKHYWVVNRNNHIYSTLGNTYLRRNFFTEDLQELEDGTVNKFNQGNFGNDLDFQLNDFFIGMHYKFQSGIFTFDQGAFLHYYNWNVNQQKQFRKEKLVFLPSFSAVMKFSKRKELEFEYKITSSFSDAAQFANKYYLQSYNSVYRGNESLENQLSHNFLLQYNKFSTYRGARYNAAVTYRKQVQGVVSAVDYQGINRSVMPIMLDNPESSWGLNGSIEQKLFDINFKFGLRHYATENAHQTNNLLKTSKTRNSTLRFSAKTLFDQFPILEIGYRQGLGKYSLDGEQSSEFFTSEPYLNLDYDFLKGFIASVNYSSFHYKNISWDERHNYQVANASLYYKKASSAWNFEIEAKNLFDVEFKNRNSFSAFVISDIRTYILPRILMFTVGYNL